VNSAKLLSLTAIVPTANRAAVLRKTLESMAKQNCQPETILVVDASVDNGTEQLCAASLEGLVSRIQYLKAEQKGAAVQRSQALALVNTPAVFFFDDDVVFEPACVERLWNCLQSGDQVGGVNALVTNQHYHDPGKLTKFMYRLMNGKNLLSYAGKCIGPAWNLLPADKQELPEYNEVEWLYTTCTMYRVSALPTPLFSNRFQGYSMLEDLALSLTVAKKYKLFNVRNARIFHDSQPGDHKSNKRALAKMELLNRHYIMTRILNRTRFSDYCKLLIFELFGIVVVLTNISGWKNLLPATVGKIQAVGNLLFSKNKYE
jgi:glycosyltransferase involved in cell wall biosynthesis